MCCLLPVYANQPMAESSLHWLIVCGAACRYVLMAAPALDVAGRSGVISWRFSSSVRMPTLWRNLRAG